MEKALWDTSLESGNLGTLLKHARDTGCKLVCIRTTSSILPKAIAQFTAAGISVYGWRWPAVKQKLYHAPHYYALDEAHYVAKALIPAGLAGYIADPESDGAGQDNDWNSAEHAPLARAFCKQIKDAAPAGFHFGVTSGCEYPTGAPNIPWANFVAASDALYPQTYWRWLDPKTGKPGPIHGGAPATAYARGVASWKTIAAGKPIIAIGGEIGVLSAAEAGELGQFAQLVVGHQPIVHFFSDSAAVDPTVLKAIAAL